MGRTDWASVTLSAHKVTDFVSLTSGAMWNPSLYVPHIVPLVSDTESVTLWAGKVTEAQSGSHVIYECTARSRAAVPLCFLPMRRSSSPHPRTTESHNCWGKVLRWENLQPWLRTLFLKIRVLQCIFSFLLLIYLENPARPLICGRREYHAKRK